jgi:hypothetical protein
MTSQVDQELHHLTSPKKLSRQWGALHSGRHIDPLSVNNQNLFEGSVNRQPDKTGSGQPEQVTSGFHLLQYR